MKKYLLSLILIFSISGFAQNVPHDFHPRVGFDFSTLTSLNTITVLIKFQGESEFSSARSTYDAPFNSTTAASLKSYYKEVSYNKLDITTYIYPECAATTNLSFTFPKPRGYFMDYSASNTIGYRTVKEGRLREHEILDSAVRYISSQVSPAIGLDYNNDGFVDNVMFIFSGSTGPWADVGLWPHSGVLDSYNTLVNGKRVYHYSIHLNSMLSWSTYCHETFHVLGAPDLYRYFVNGTPVGSWDIMASGSAHMGAYMKYKYTSHTWISNIPKITNSGTYTLSPLTSDTNNCYRIDSPYSKDEFFILEYRKQGGMFESGIPGSGLLVYRVNTLAGDGDGGGPPDELYIYRKGGTPTVGGSVSSAHFSSTVGRTAINDYTTDPKSFLANGSVAGLDIKNIGAAGTIISFLVTIVDCSISQPADNSVFKKGDTVNVKALALDSANISKVDFYIDSVLVKTVNTYPYNFRWNTAVANIGKHIMKARATSITGVYKEATINLFVTANTPVVQIVNLQDSVKINRGDTLRVDVTALSPFGKITAVKLFVDGVLSGTLTSSPYIFRYPTSGINFGKRIIKVTAIDSSGNEGDVQITSFIVKYLLREGFESNWLPANWTSNSSVYGWYQSPKGALSGLKCAATRNYHAMGEAILETPSITLEDNSHLVFYWMDRSLDITVANKQLLHDTTYCEMSIENAPYILLKFLSSLTVDADYSKVDIDLTQYKGKNVKIRWRDVSDESMDAQGTALDEVSLTAYPPPTAIECPQVVVAPANFSLEQNFPNPFNPETVISYSIAMKGHVSIKVFDVLGKEIANLVDEEKGIGNYNVMFSAGNLASGIYYYRIKSGGFSATRKLVIVK